MPESTFQTVELNTEITLHACTSDTTDEKQYIDKPASGTFITYKLKATACNMVFYYLTDANGKKYVVGSEPKSIRH